jgi:hypothetical protein
LAALAARAPVLLLDVESQSILCDFVPSWSVDEESRALRPRYGARAKQVAVLKQSSLAGDSLRRSRSLTAELRAATCFARAP